MSRKKKSLPLLEKVTITDVAASNVGERLDISDCLSYEDLVKKDSSVVKRGGIILKKDEQIASVTYKKGRR